MRSYRFLLVFAALGLPVHLFGCSSNSTDGLGGTGGMNGTAGAAGKNSGQGGGQSAGKGGAPGGAGGAATGGSAGGQAAGGTAGSQAGAGGAAGSAGSGGSAGSAGSSGGSGGAAGGMAGAGGMKTGMSFFLTSVGPGMGADLDGLDGADAHCKKLATAVGAGDRMWRAYLSQSAKGNLPAVNARDRIGAGPWQNQKGIVVATSVDNLHSDGNKLGKENSIDEKGAVVNGRTDNPNRHDILTGSTAEGRAYPAMPDKTCDNWNASGQGAARVGHHDKMGGGAAPMSWNSSHDSSGCSQANLRSTGGDGLFYCFAAN